MKICIIDSNTKTCVNVVMLGSPSDWIPVEGQEVANNHDGGIGLQLTDSGWVNPSEVAYVITWDIIRTKRDIKLSVCDWTVLPDSPLTDAKKLEWITYRQQLRDLPETFTNPEDVVWPTPP